MTFSFCVHNGFYFFWIQPSPFGTYAKALGMTQDDFGSCHQFWIDLENGTCFQPTQVLPRGLIGGVNRSRYASLRVASSCLALNCSLSHPGLHRLERLVLEAGRNWRNSSCTVLFVSFVSCLTVEDWWQSGRWDWWEKETGIHWNTMQVLQKCRFEKFEDEQNLGVSRSASPKRLNVYQAICGLMRSVFASMFVVPKSFVLQDFGIRISMKDPWWGELLPRPWWNILTIILFSSSLAEAEQELERINAVMNVKFLALWGLLCHLCQASASSTSGGRHGVGSVDFFILPSTWSTFDPLIFKIAQVLQLRENLRNLGQTAKPQKSDEWKGLQNLT